MRLQVRVFALFSAVILMGSVCQGATITGTVKGVDGAPFQGAFVMAANTKTKITVNVLSDSQGHYRIEQLPAGDYRVQIKAVGFTAAPQNGVTLTADQNTSFDFALQKGSVRWNEISFYQAMQLFPSTKGNALLNAHCETCHLFQSRFASVRRDADGWKDRVAFMRTTMQVHLSDEEADDIATYLTSLFGPDSVLPKSPADMPKYKETVRPFSSDSTKIVYVEYEMAKPNLMPFSAAPDKDGNLWIPDFGIANRITRLDPKTGQQQEFMVPNIGTARVHSAVPADDGTVWLTEQGSNKLGKWDPATQKITEYQDKYLPGREGDPAAGQKHTLRIATNGKVWSSGTPFTMFDPETEKYTRFDEVPMSYDVKTDKNGNAWFTAPRANTIGIVDGKTMKVTQWTVPTPKSYPRRMELDADGTIWVGEFDAGKLAHFDPKTGTFKEYKLPGPDATPYGMGIDADGNIWYDSHHQDVVGMFNPKTEKVTEYPFPHSELCMREFFLDKQGRMWYGTNPNNRVGYFYLTGKKGSTMASN
jgi:virginiamycin B lyase